MARQRSYSIGIFLLAAMSGGNAGCTEGGADSDPMGSGGTTGTGMAGNTTGGISVIGVGGGQAGTTGNAAGTGQVTNGGAEGVAGTFGAGGASGSVGTAGTGGGGLQQSGPSVGCNGEAPADEPQKAIQHDLTVAVAAKYQPTYATRKYYTNLPQSFDPKKPYPMMFYGQGCGQTGPESGPFSGGHFATDVLYIQLIPAAVTGDTVVPSNGSPGCFQAGKQGLADSPDGPYFDMVLAEVKQKYCVDTGKVYVAGWSSGAWLSNYLACARGNVITGTASGSGGLQFDHGPCTGGSRVMILDGDAGSITEDGHAIGAEEASKILIAANGASNPMAQKLGNANCQVSTGGKAPVAWCPVGGGHGGPLGSIADAAWAFWTAP